MELKEPSEEHKNLREGLIKKFQNSFVDKVRKGDSLKCRPISLELDQRKLAHMKPVNHVKPFDVPFDIRKMYKREKSDMLDAGIIVPCEVPTDWNTKAFPVVRSDGVNSRLVPRKLLWHTESCYQLMRHIPQTPGCLQL